MQLVISLLPTILPAYPTSALHTAVTLGPLFWSGGQTGNVLCLTLLPKRPDIFFFTFQDFGLKNCSWGLTLLQETHGFFNESGYACFPLASGVFSLGPKGNLFWPDALGSKEKRSRISWTWECQLHLLGPITKSSKHCSEDSVTRGYCVHVSICGLAFVGQFLPCSSSL